MLKALPISLFILCFLFTACDSDDPTITTGGETGQSQANQEGLVVLRSALTVDSAFGRVEQALVSNAQVGVVARINHAANAQNAGLSLPPTQLILFGNPRLGTPLMQQSQTAGIDLPQKMLVWEEGSGSVFVTYNDPKYLARRHGLRDTTAQLGMMTNALQGLAEQAVDASVQVNNVDASRVSLREGLIQVQSNFSVDETFSRLEQAVQNAGPLTITARLDHAANAQRVGMRLRPTKLLVFGNPSLGTPLMQSSRTIAIDLPQKMLVYQAADSTVFIAYNDPQYLANRHGIQGQDSTLTTIASALRNLANAATQ